MKNKYGAKKLVLDGMTFDSKAEAKRYAELMLLERAGEITDLQRQVVFGLIPAQRDKETLPSAKFGTEDGRLLERAVDYIADFTYRDRHGEFIVEDVKGAMTPAYVIKRKLMLWVHGIRITEVKAK